MPDPTVGQSGDPAVGQCEHVGHDWADAGGGLLICMACQAERWADETPRRGRSGGSR